MTVVPNPPQPDGPPPILPDTEPAPTGPDPVPGVEPPVRPDPVGYVDSGPMPW
jgi:hypothetical protein